MTEAEELQERHYTTAGKYFWPLVRKQKQRFSERTHVIMPYKGSPRWDREKEKLDREWKEWTAEAERIYLMALTDLDTIGEVSEATSLAYDAVAAKIVNRT
jgi:hypothetical protein